MSGSLPHFIDLSEKAIDYLKSDFNLLGHSQYLRLVDFHGAAQGSQSV